MAKLPHQSTVTPIDPTDVVNRSYGDSNYTGGVGGTGGFSLNSVNLVQASTQYVQIADAAQNGVLEGMPDLTIEGWFKPSTLPGVMGLVSKYSSFPGNLAYRFRMATASSVSVEISTNGTDIGTGTRIISPAPVVGEWIHLAFTWDGTFGDVFVFAMGIQQSILLSVYPLGNIYDGTNDFKIGFDEGGSHFNGDVAHVRVWNTVRSATELLSNMRRTLAGDEPGLVGYWKFDNDFIDSTSNGNNLTGVNSPTFVENTPFGAPAHAIITPGGTVRVEGSAPTIGHVLTATGTDSVEFTAPGSGSDVNAIHDNISDEFSNVAEKITKVSADRVLIEDSEDTFAKKYQTVGTLCPSSSFAPISSTCLEVVADGSDNHLELDSVSAEAGGLGLQGPAFTMECWFKPTTLGVTHSLIGRGSTSGGVLGAILNVSDTTVEFQGRRASGTVLVTFSRTLVQNEWVHYAVSRLTSTGNTILYVNGVEVANTIQGPTDEMTVETGINWSIGGDTLNPGEHATGRFFEVRKWNIERSASQILTSYKHSLDPSELGLNGYWRFDGDFTDSTTNNNDLTITAGASPAPVANVIDAPFSARSATSLESAGGLIDVSQASTPILGDVLTADGAGNATWIAPTVGGGGSPPAAQGDFLRATLLADQTNVTAGTVVGWDSEIAQRGDVSLNVVNGQITIPADRTYLILAQVHMGDTVGFDHDLHWYDVTAAAIVPGTETRHRTTTAVSHESNGNVVKAIVSPTVETIYELRVSAVSPSGSSDIEAIYTSLEVLEVGAPASVPDELLNSAKSNLWYPPETPHADDVEFDSTTLPAGWAENFTPTVPINAYDTIFTSGDPRRSLHSEARLSWYMVQAPGNGSGYMLYLDKTTLPTNLLMVSRCKININGSNAVNNDAGIGIFMSEDGGSGAPGMVGSGNIDDGVTLAMNEQDGGTVQGELFRYVGGVFASGGATTDVDRMGQALSYVALHKIGNTYHGWFGTESGNWIRIGAVTQAFSMRFVGLFFQNQNATAPGPSIAGSDFIRFYDTDNFLL